MPLMHARGAQPETAHLTAVIALMKDRCDTLVQLADAAMLFYRVVTIDPAMKEATVTAAIVPALEAFVGGAVLVIVLALATRIVRYPFGVWVGWVLQALLLATGILLPALYIAAAFFVAMWIFCFVRARQIDRANASRMNPSEGNMP